MSERARSIGRILQSRCPLCQWRFVLSAKKSFKEIEYRLDCSYLCGRCRNRLSSVIRIVLYAWRSGYAWCFWLRRCCDRNCRSSFSTRFVHLFLLLKCQREHLREIAEDLIHLLPRRQVHIAGRFLNSPGREDIRRILGLEHMDSRERSYVIYAGYFQLLPFKIVQKTL